MGTHDVSLLTLDNGLFEVKATSGNTHLGGQDFDNKLVTWCLKEFKRVNKNVNVEEMMTNKKVLGKLRSACEKAKKILSSTVKTNIEVDSLFDGIDFSAQLTRAKFEELCAADFEKSLEPVNQVLLDAKMSKADITDIVLIGGSTRIPKVRELLKKHFNGKEPKQDINPDEAVAYGAAVQGAILAKVNDAKITSMVLVDVTPLSLGIETAGGMMAKIIQRNSTIPCCKEQTFSTYSDNQPGVTVKVFEGEREFTQHNNLLGTFELTNIPPMPRGIPKILVKFDIDANGIMNVTATEESTGRCNKITIKNDKDRLTPKQLEDMIQEAMKFKDDDMKEKERLDARNELENYIYNARNSANTEEFKQNVGEENSKLISDIVKETIQWIEDNPDCSKEEFTDKKKEVESQITPIFMSGYNKEKKEQPETSEKKPGKRGKKVVVDDE